MKRDQIIHETVLLATGLHSTADRLLRAAEDGNLDAIATITLPTGLGKIHGAIADITRLDKIRAAIARGLKKAAEDESIRTMERSLLIDYIANAFEEGYADR